MFNYIFFFATPHTTRVYLLYGWFASHITLCKCRYRESVTRLNILTHSHNILITFSQHSNTFSHLPREIKTRWLMLNRQGLVWSQSNRQSALENSYSDLIFFFSFNNLYQHFMRNHTMFTSYKSLYFDTDILEWPVQSCNRSLLPYKPMEKIDLRWGTVSH